MYICHYKFKNKLINMKAKIRYNGKIIEVNAACNNLNTWVLYKGEWYKNLL